MIQKESTVDVFLADCHRLLPGHDSKRSPMASDPFPSLRLSLQGPVAWIEYNRPPVNAFDWEMLRAFPAALACLAENAAVRVIVISSALPRFFNSGADLSVFQKITPKDMGEWVDVCHGLVADLRRCPKPLLACIQGVAVGGGLEITWHCDVRFCAEDARIGQPEVGIGFIPPIGATQALARLAGRHRALRLLYEGKLLSATQARDWGLVDVVLPVASLRDEVQRYALELANKPAATLAAIRRCVTAGDASGYADGLAIEREAAVRLAGLPDFREGVRAFLDKREPVWTHSFPFGGFP